MTDGPDLDTELQLHLKHAAYARELIGRAVDGTSSRYEGAVPLRARVCLVLMVRVSNDIRAVEHLAALGYNLQAATIAASTFESTYAVLEIVDSDERARKWLDHDDPTRSAIATTTAVESAIRGSGLDNVTPLIVAELKCYAQLCMAKHANPLLQAGHGFELTEDTVRMVFGPAFDEGSVQVGLFALQHAARFAVMVIAAYSRFHVGDAELHGIALSAGELEGNRRKLNERSRARGWDIDHLAGLWGRIEGRR